MRNVQEFAQELRLSRRHYGLSQSDFAKKAGVSETTVSKFEKGHYPGWLERILIASAIRELDETNSVE